MTYLQRRLCEDGAFSNPQIDIRLIQADLLHFPFNTKYDLIVFSLPLTIFPPQMVEDILRTMMDHLQPEGVFSFVRYALLGRLRYLFGSSTEQAQLCARQSIIDRFSERYQIGQSLVWANVPPTWVYYWYKATDTVETSATLERLTEHSKGSK
jgi:phospholipid N-methyltransferase